MKKFIWIWLLTLTFASLLLGGKAHAATFNILETAYYPDTAIGQVINFTSGMQAGGSMSFSVYAQDGGGRAGETDTAYLKITFYNSSNAIVNSQQTTPFSLSKTQFTQLTLTVNNCGGSCSNVAYAIIEMVGTDASFWAGDYGVYWKLPEVTFGGSSTNLVYNPEFGVAPGTLAVQGWTQTSQWGDPGFGVCQGAWGGANSCITDTTIIANSTNGGYTATGGTTSAPAGGYSGPPPPPPPPPFDGTITQTNSPGTETITSGSGSSAGYTGTQETRVNTWANGSQNYNNVLYIEQTYGSNNTVSITQSGTKNRTDFTLNGNGNVATTTQTGSNYLKEEIPGWGNNITINQTNTTLTNYTETKIQGNGNTVNHTQTGPGNHVLFNTIAGDINTVNTTQTGNAGHYAETKLTGNWNSARVDQSGNTTNKANIDLTNNGGAATLDLQQTGGKNFTIIQSCVNPAGCNTTVRQ